MQDIKIQLMRGELTIGDAVNEIERLETLVEEFSSAHNNVDLDPELRNKMRLAYDRIQKVCVWKTPSAKNDNFLAFMGGVDAIISELTKK